MNEFRISTDPDQQFGATLNNSRVTLRLRYNPLPDRWSFDLSIDDVPILTGRRIVVGVDLLAAYPSINLGAIFAADVVAGSVPNRADLPNGKVKLFQASDAEIINAVLA